MWEHIYLFWSVKMEDTGKINVTMIAGEFEQFKEVKRRAALKKTNHCFPTAQAAQSFQRSDAYF